MSSIFPDAPAKRKDTADGAAEPGVPPPAKRRLLNIYDAVAGRAPARYNTTTNTTTVHDTSTQPPALSPEDALFRQANAPLLFAEYDLYDAAGRLLPDAGAQTLPSGDLLQALHAYASHFYEELAVVRGQRVIDERSLDETALLALGVLLEEAGREVLGKRGELVFTEGVDRNGVPVAGIDQPLQVIGADVRRGRRKEKGSKTGQSRKCKKTVAEGVAAGSVGEKQDGQQEAPTQTGNP